MQYFLKGRGYLRASAGRRGAVNAFLSMMAYCGVDLDRKTYPDGRDGDTLISTWLSTFAFFLSKVIELRVLWLSGELSGWCLYYVCVTTPLGEGGGVDSVYSNELVLTNLLLSSWVIVLASWWLCLAWKNDCCP